ncbi:MAG: FAD-dependent oxidoreductase, partial [Chloroflexi bacterium]|nr:FAD-dependent oxidoreductase [Chloroflexota bacterium]
MKTVVVGAGLFGTSIAFSLAKRAAGSIVLVDRGNVCGGDSGRSFSMVRRHYSNDVTARLAMRGVDVIQRWDEEVGVADSGFVQTGYLLTAPPEQEVALRDNVLRLRLLGLDTRVVEPDEIAALDPLLSLDGIAAGAYEPGGGFADAQKMVLGWFAAGVARGVHATLGRQVTGICVRDGRAAGVETDAGPIDADVVVLATGSWGPELARTAGVDLPITLRRLQVAIVRLPPDQPHGRLTFSDMATNLVFRPDRAGRALAVAYQEPELLECRDACDEHVDP